MPPRTMPTALHNTTTAGSTEARELDYNADERRSNVPAGRRRPAATVRFRPLGVVEDASSRKDSHPYYYSYSCSYRLACRSRQHDSSCILSISPSCGSSSGRGGGRYRVAWRVRQHDSSCILSISPCCGSSSGRSGGRAERTGALACVGRAQ